MKQTYDMTGTTPGRRPRPKTADAVAAVRRAYTSPPAEITRSITLTGETAARYAFAESLLINAQGMDADAAAAFLLSAGAVREVQRFTEAMAAMNAAMRESGEGASPNGD
jgi:hypothetical protein